MVLFSKPVLIEVLGWYDCAVTQNNWSHRCAQLPNTRNVKGGRSTAENSAPDCNGKSHVMCDISMHLLAFSGVAYFANQYSPSTCPSFKPALGSKTAVYLAVP